MVNQPAEGNGLLDLAGAAAHLGVSEAFVRRLVLERRVRYFKLGSSCASGPPIWTRSSRREGGIRWSRGSTSGHHNGEAHGMPARHGERQRGSGPAGKRADT